MKEKLTISDIANLAGVAKSTVSRFLNGGYVSEKNREKIKKIIEKKKYEPNAFARSLKAKKNKFIGIVTPTLDSFVASKILTSLDEKLRKKGYIPLIMNSNHDKKLEINSLENLWRLNVEGIIILATEVSSSHIDLLQKIKIPTVVLGQKFSNTISIKNDDYNAGVIMGDYIGRMGHKNVLYIGVGEEDISVGFERKNGVISGLEKHELENLYIETSDFSLESSEKIVREFIKRKSVTAIICATDNMALGAFKAIEESGYKVPMDISLVGFGGYTISSLINPKLTTIKFDNTSAGILAADTIIKLINDRVVPETQIVGFEFLERESVKKLS